MACTIPRFIAIKPDICLSYACYETGTESGYVFCNEKSVFNPFTKIELEQAKGNTNYYNLRFCQSNRYWAKSEDNKHIVAVSKQPDEDTSKSSCTLFKPTIDDKGHLRLTHVSGNSVQTDSATTGLLLGKDTSGSDTFAFTFVDYDALVKLPSRVVFKADNGNFLRAVMHDDLPCLEFTSTNPSDGYSAQEVHLHRDGHLQIKSVFHGKFWRRSSDKWILADSSDYGGNDKDTLFWPKEINDKTITLQNAGNSELCGSLTADGKTDALIAPGNDPNFEVQVLVLESYVHNVSFREEDSRVFDELSYVAASTVLTNHSDADIIETVKFTIYVTNSFSYTHSYSLKIDAKTSFNAGKPNDPTVEKHELAAEYDDFADDFAVDFVGPLAWGQTVLGKKSVVVSDTVKVPAKSRVKVDCTGIHCKWNVPFSYTQRDTYSGDGDYDDIDHNDGIFYGGNDYGFTVVPSAPEPLC